MNLRRIVEVVWYPCNESSVDLPDNARILAVDFYDAQGIHQGRRPAGVWVEIVIERYDEDHPENKPLPPPAP